MAMLLLEVWMYRLTGYITLDHFCRYVLAGYFPCVNFQRQLYTCKCSFKSFIMMKLCKACRLLSFDDSEMFHFYRCIDQRTGTMTRVVLSHGQVTIQLVLSTIQLIMAVGCPLRWWGCRSQLTSHLPCSTGNDIPGCRISNHFQIGCFHQRTAI